MNDKPDTDQLLPKVYGEHVNFLPQDLYIPPDALEVYLDSFEGPLDLLLYLIRKNNIDILDIPMANLTSQYMVYVEKMKGVKLELAADYLLMSAMLIEIKSRMLLPAPESDERHPDERAPRDRLRPAGVPVDHHLRVVRVGEAAAADHGPTHAGGHLPRVLQ